MGNILILLAGAAVLFFSCIPSIRRYPTASEAPLSVQYAVSVAIYLAGILVIAAGVLTFIYTIEHIAGRVIIG